jgi:hypothetical protein
MQTSGNGNDGLMILFSIGVTVIVGVILFGGPANAVEAINNIVGDMAREAMTMVSAWF